MARVWTVPFARFSSAPVLALADHWVLRRPPGISSAPSANGNISGQRTERAGARAGRASLVLIFKALHVLSMFAAIAFLVAESTLFATAIWRGDVRALAAMRRLAGRRPVVGALLLLIGIGFGVLTVATGGFDFFAGWLLAAYVLVVATVGINVLPVVQKGFLGLSDMAAEAEAGRIAAAEVAEKMRGFRGRFAAIVAANMVGFAAIILDMVLKPF
jgi:uncharacterized membrane protein